MFMGMSLVTMMKMECQVCHEHMDSDSQAHLVFHGASDICPKCGKKMEEGWHKDRNLRRRVQRYLKKWGA